MRLRKDTGADPSILERTVYAFGLLEAIRKVNMPFIFKGGTALLVMLEHPRRLSTDIDIIVEHGTDVDGFIKKAYCGNNKTPNGVFIYMIAASRAIFIIWVKLVCLCSGVVSSCETRLSEMVRRHAAFLWSTRALEKRAKLSISTATQWCTSTTSCI